jgi:hypothetical protein
MKYYLYASAAKTEMLFDQLTGASKRTVISKIALGPSAARFESSAQAEQTSALFARLDAVEEALEVDRCIASLDPETIETLPSFCRVSELWSASLISKSYQLNDSSSEWGSSYCLFHDGGDILALLVGSQSNVLGGPAHSTTCISPSFTVDEYLLSVAESYWSNHGAAIATSNLMVDRHLVALLQFGGEIMAYHQPKSLRVLFRVFGVYQVHDRDIEEVYQRGHPVFVGNPRLLVTGSPLYVALEP